MKTITLGGLVITCADDPADEAPAPAPLRRVSMRQARLALLEAGKLAAVNAAIAGLPEPEKSAAQIEWEYSAAVERNGALLAQLGPALGLSPAQIDALFARAAQL